MTKDKALKLALEALETCCAGDYSTGHVIDPSFDEDAVNEAITAIKEALAPTSTQCEVQPEQEPVAWAVVGDGKFGKVEIGQHVEIDLDACSYWVNRGYSLVPCYTTPPKRPWVGLTDDETKEQIKHSDLLDMFEHIGWYSAPRKGFDKNAILLIQAIEAKLKEKNT